MLWSPRPTQAASPEENEGCCAVPGPGVIPSTAKKKKTQASEGASFVGPSLAPRTLQGVPKVSPSRLLLVTQRAHLARDNQRLPVVPEDNHRQVDQEQRHSQGRAEPGRRLLTSHLR